MRIKNDTVDLNPLIHTAAQDRLCLEMLLNRFHRMILFM